MTYLNPNNRQSRVRPVYILAVFIALLVAGTQFFAPHVFPSLYISIAKPFWRTQFGITGGSLSSTQSLLNENENLRRQLAANEVLIQSDRALSIENAELRRLMERATTTNSTLAAVLKKPPFAPYDELIIDAGADRGFTVGSKVYASGNILIGYVADVLADTSKVRLLSSPGEKYQVMIGAARTPATAVGRGGGQYLAELPSDVQIEENEPVISPNLDDGTFGIVTSVVSDPTQAFKSVLFAPPVNIYQLRYVLVQTK